jgi:tetratricopeptide (TPR) repeat protein
MKYFAALLGLLALLTAASVSANDPRSSARYYIETYGALDPSQNDKVERAHEIFQRLLQVADRTINIQPRLRLIQGKGKPWAIAIPDGTVILTQGALEICYLGADTSLGDSRLALILGHEISHLTNNDFWHRDVHQILIEQSDTTSEDFRDRIAAFAGAAGSESSELWKQSVRQKELIADDRGFLYAALAGYRPYNLLDNGGSQRNFFSFWVQQTRVGVDELHASPEERVALLTSRFQSISEKIELYEYGVRLLSLGKVEDAIVLLRLFQKSFPSPVVMNNLGWAYLHKALKMMPSEQVYQFWLPTVIDAANPLGDSRGFSVQQNQQAITHALENAVDYLEQATRLDPSYLPGFINLATAHWYLGQFHQARAAIERARSLDGNNPEILGFRALILFVQDQEIDMWSTSIGLLKPLTEGDNPSAMAIYNIARMMEIRGRDAQASKYWTLLADGNYILPGNIHQGACTARNDKQCVFAESQRGSIPFLNEFFPIGSLLNADFYPKGSDWSSKMLSSDGVEMELFTHSTGVRVLALDDQPELVVSAAIGNKTLRDVEHLVGMVQQVWESPSGQLRSYAGNVVVDITNDDTIEVWMPIE